MAINTTPKEMPTGDGHPTAGNVSTHLDYPVDPLIGKDLCGVVQNDALLFLEVCCPCPSHDDIPEAAKTKGHRCPF